MNLPCSFRDFARASPLHGAIVLLFAFASLARAQTLDFGDAPAIYPTTLAADGARHTATGPRLGTDRDVETNGQPNVTATGDDIAGTPDDEDGVVFPAQVMAGGFATIAVAVVGGDAKFDAWIDFNHDGDWNDANEHIGDGVDVVTGANVISFLVPDDLNLAPGATTQSAARLRLSTVGHLATTGAAADGEVEDYVVTLAAPAPATNVRAWYANGQVFVVWDYNTTLAPETFEIFRSDTAVNSTAQASKIGRLFEPEFGNSHILEEFIPAYGVANAPTGYLIPNGSGGTLRLTSGQGLFVATVRASGSHFYSVVPHGQTTIAASNRTATAVTETFSLAQPPIYHLQSNGTNTGQPVQFHVVWLDGDDNIAAGRADFPIMANTARAGIPRIIMTVLPVGGLAGAGPHPAMLGSHGADGQATHWLPDSQLFLNSGAEEFPGVIVGLEDKVFRIEDGRVQGGNTLWFGWVASWDPFSRGAFPPNDAVVLNYTHRWLSWTLDTLLASPTLNLDSDRISASGYSRGSAGLLHFTRSNPERFSSVTLYSSPLEYFGDGPQHWWPQGHADQNLLTNQTTRDGQPIRLKDTMRINPIPVPARDLPFTRLIIGQREEFFVFDTDHDFVPDMPTALRTADMNGICPTLYWDLRKHGIELWTYAGTVADLTNRGVAQPTTWTAEDFWAPSVATQLRRDDAAYQTRYRVRQSYPAFTHFQNYAGHRKFGTTTYPNNQGTYYTQTSEDTYLGTLTVQDRFPPVIDGDDFGSWGGYHEWEPSTIVDTSTKWEATLWLVNAAAQSGLAAVDTCPLTQLTADVALRKPQSFRPAQGTGLLWRVTDATSSAVLQNGSITVGAADLVTIAGVTVRRDPARVKLTIETAGGTGAPTISAITGNTVASAGASVTFGVTAGGAAPFTYQWTFNGAAIPGATSASYVLPSVQSFHAGSYAVIVTNSAGSIVSNAATLTVSTPASGGRLANLSTRGFVGVNDAVMIPGIVIDAAGSARLLIRAVGPTLENFGVNGTLADPVLTLYSGNTVLTTSDNWGTSGDSATIANTGAQVFAFPLAADSKDAAMVVTLPPGTYTAVATGAGGTTGIVLVEVYLAP